MTSTNSAVSPKKTLGQRFSNFCSKVWNGTETVQAIRTEVTKSTTLGKLTTKNKKINNSLESIKQNFDILRFYDNTKSISSSKIKKAVNNYHDACNALEKLQKNSATGFIGQLKQRRQAKQLINKIRQLKNRTEKLTHDLEKQTISNHSNSLEEAFNNFTKSNQTAQSIQYARETKGLLDNLVGRNLVYEKNDEIIYNISNIMSNSEERSSLNIDTIMKKSTGEFKNKLNVAKELHNFLKNNGENKNSGVIYKIITQFARLGAGGVDSIQKVIALHKTEVEAANAAAKAAAVGSSIPVQSFNPLEALHKAAVKISTNLADPTFTESDLKRAKECQDLGVHGSISLVAQIINADKGSVNKFNALRTQLGGKDAGNRAVAKVDSVTAN